MVRVHADGVKQYFVSFGGNTVSTGDEETLSAHIEDD